VLLVAMLALATLMMVAAPATASEDKHNTAPALVDRSNSGSNDSDRSASGWNQPRGILPLDECCVVGE
jgi:hypothetical protein